MNGQYELPSRASVPTHIVKLTEAEIREVVLKTPVWDLRG
jgi:hypothetical protein